MRITLRAFLMQTVSWPCLRQPKLGAREMADVMANAYRYLGLTHLDAV